MLALLEGMESKDGSSSTHLAYTNRHVPIPLSPYPFLPSPYSDDFSQLQSNEDHLKSSEGGLSYHQRCSSESFLFDEEPSWLDDLLDDPETVHYYKGHRRSASDSYAYLGETVEKLNIGEEYGCENVGFRSSKVHNYADQTFFASKTNSLAERKNQQEIAVSSVAVEQTKDENSSKNSEDSADKVSGGSQVKPYASKEEGKRAKQHNAHRSRTRKLQYIVHLEKTVEILKAEGSEVSAELEFLEQQNMILTMENRALRQRLDSVSQEQAIKQWEQGMLEREIARLQTMFHVQKQQQLQQQHSHNHQHYKHRRNRSKDFDHQVNSNNNPIKMKDAAASSSKALPNAPVWA